MKYEIKRANESDVKIANDYLTKLIADEKKYDKNINDNCVVSSLYENLIPQDDNLVLFAYVGEKIVGYLFGFVMNNGDAYLETVTQLEAMYVDEDYRGFGIGNALIEKFKSWSLEKKAKYMELKVCNSNYGAISLYEKNGFKGVKTIMSIELEW